MKGDKLLNRVFLFFLVGYNWETDTHTVYYQVPNPHAAKQKKDLWGMVLDLCFFFLNGSGWGCLVCNKHSINVANFQSAHSLTDVTIGSWYLHDNQTSNIQFGVEVSNFLLPKTWSYDLHLVLMAHACKLAWGHDLFSQT